MYSREGCDANVPIEIVVASPDTTVVFYMACLCFVLKIKSRITFPPRMTQNMKENGNTMGRTMAVPCFSFIIIVSVAVVQNQ